MIERPRIVNYRQTCDACPSQWEGTLNDGRMFYIHYRYGHGEVSVSEKPTRNVMDAVRGEIIFHWGWNDKDMEWDGSIGEHTLRELTQHVIEWPEF